MQDGPGIEIFGPNFVWLLHGAEMLQHRMIPGKAELAIDHRVNRRNLGTVKLHAFAADFHIHPIEHAHEVEMPEGPAHFAVRDGFKPHILLHLDQRDDFEVFDGFQFGGWKILCPGFDDGARPKEAAHMIGAEGGCVHISSLAPVTLKCIAQSRAKRREPRLKWRHWSNPSRRRSGCRTCSELAVRDTALGAVELQARRLEGQFTEIHMVRRTLPSRSSTTSSWWTRSTRPGSAASQCAMSSR